MLRCKNAKSPQGEFASWFPYKIMRVHVKLLEPNEIPRPVVDLDRVVGSSKLYRISGGLSVR